jgi:hypothetical protein
VGVFSSLGIMAYVSHLYFERSRGHELTQADLRFGSQPLLAASMYFLFVLVGIIGIFLVLSRGTIAVLMGTLALYFLLMLLRFAKKIPWLLVIMIFFIAGFFLKATVKTEKIFKDTASLQLETKSKDSSLGSTLEGIRRAKAIHKDYWPWGAGYEGYSEVSRKYAVEGEEKKFRGANSFVISHYFHVWAEQGMGAYIYFAFLAVFLIEWMIGLFRTSSHYKFIAGLSLGFPVLMILLHASIAFLMERYMIATLVYVLMGASLAVLRRDFKHT